MEAKARVIKGHTLDIPSSVIEDVTLQRERVKHALDVNKAALLKRTLDRYYLRVVKCPWGCNEYYTKAGSVEFDLLFRRIIGNHVKCHSSLKRAPYVQGVREDLLDRHEVQETFAWNPKWPVMPSVAFDMSGNGNPVLSFLTCRCHGG